LGAVVLLVACTKGKGSPVAAVRSPAFDTAPNGEFGAPDPYSLKKTRCEVHGSTLITAVVPATMGDPDYAPGYGAASQRLFPNANVSVDLGCLGPPAARIRAKYCMECRRARSTWMLEHPDVDGRGYRP